MAILNSRRILLRSDVLKILLVAGSIILPFIMLYSCKYSVKLKNIFNLIAVIAALVFGNIASLSIYTVINDNVVFMTRIHAIFLNPFFLIAGAYLGIYFLYLLLRLTVAELQNKNS